MKKTICFFMILLSVAVIFSGCKNNTSTIVPTAIEDYVFEQDFQYNLNKTPSCVITKAPNGYYYILNSNLMLFDTTLKKKTVLCDRANCTHDSNECSAYLDYTHYKMQLHYYNENLYTHMFEEKNGVLSHYIEQISLDGRTREKKCLLFKSAGSASFNFFIHRGYVYLSREIYIDGTQTQKIYKISLDAKNEELEEVFSFSGIETGLNYVYALGNHIYFSLGYLENEESEVYTQNIYDYNILENTINQLQLKNFGWRFTVYNREIYYYDTEEKQYVKYNIDKDEYSPFYDYKEEKEISTDGKRLYIDIPAEKDGKNDSIHRVIAIDLNTKNTTEYSCDKMKSICCYGDTDYLIFLYVLENECDYVFIEK